VILENPKEGEPKNSIAERMPDKEWQREDLLVNRESKNDIDIILIREIENEAKAYDG
jgi:hypothetical protein